MNLASSVLLLGFLHTAVSDECTAGEFESIIPRDEASLDVTCVTAQFGDAVCYEIFDRGVVASDFRVTHRAGECDNQDLQTSIETCQGEAESLCKVCNPYSAALRETCVTVECTNDQADCTLAYRVSLNEDTACRLEQEIDLSNDGTQEIYITDACAERPKVCVQVESEEVIASSFEMNMYANCLIDNPEQRRARDDAGDDNLRCFTGVADGDCVQIVCDNEVYDCDLKISIGDETFNAAESVKASISLVTVLIAATMFSA